VQRADLRPGDLVFFNTLRRTFSHVGIYIGDNRFVHAPRSGKLIRTESLNFAYWSDRFTGARRVAAYRPAQPPDVASAADAGRMAP
jgi:cell wall-associated NlpC family hydrolase